MRNTIRPANWFSWILWSYKIYACWLAGALLLCNFSLLFSLFFSSDFCTSYFIIFLLTNWPSWSHNAWFCFLTVYTQSSSAENKIKQQKESRERIEKIFERKFFAYNFFFNSCLKWPISIIVLVLSFSFITQIYLYMHIVSSTESSHI